MVGNSWSFVAVLAQVQDCYRVTNDTSLGIKTPIPKQRETRPQNVKPSGLFSSVEALEEVALNAAYKVAEAESKELAALDAVREAERIAKMAEETEIMLSLAKEIYEQCNSKEISFNLCDF